MSSLVLTGSTSGTVSVQAPAIAGSNTATLAAATGTHYPFTAGTAVASTSGTSIDFTSIPSWVKRITVLFSGVSTNGSSNYLIQVGSGSVTTSGYLGASADGPTLAVTAFTDGFGIRAPTAAATIYGTVTIDNITSTSWVASGTLARGSSAVFITTAGGVTLSGALDRVRITTGNGTDTFDAGSINILYEG